MEETVRPLGARVLVRVEEEASVTASGLVIPDTAKDKPQRGVVVAVGDDDELLKVAVGDRVLYPRYSGTELRLKGVDHLILEAPDLLAVVGSAPSRAA
ncbi:MAG: co-chaperone GroES [Actinomycetota bacterium]|jgi:chaperonin GroES|nr:co-chaperone GroES [Actinomycetota bacterium]